MISVCCLSAERKALSTKTPPTRHGLWDKVWHLWTSPTFSNPPVMTFKTASRVNLEWKNNCKPSIFIWGSAQNSASNAMYSSCLSYIYNPIWITSFFVFSQVAMFQPCLDFHHTSTFSPYPSAPSLRSWDNPAGNQPTSSKGSITSCQLTSEKKKRNQPAMVEKHGLFFGGKKYTLFHQKMAQPL